MVILAATGVIATGWCWGWHRVHEQALQVYNPENLIRFHVLANSDTPADQALKYKVRDTVVQSMSPRFGEAGDIETARKTAKENLEYIKQVALERIKAEGKDYPVTVSLGRFDFPTKTYHIKAADENKVEDLTLPAGEYEAVRVVIGNGDGANWWCVLFPPLCFVNPTSVQPQENTEPDSFDNSSSNSECTEKNNFGQSDGDASVPAFKQEQVSKEMASLPDDKADNEVLAQDGPIFKLRITEVFKKSSTWFACLLGHDGTLTLNSSPNRGSFVFGASIICILPA